MKTPVAITTPRSRIVLVTTVQETASIFLADLSRFLLDNSFDVQFICSPSDGSLPTLPCMMHEVPMRRAISPLQDLPALARMTRLLKQLSPDIVHTHTPKAGLLGSMAAKLAGVPIRIYTVNGLPLLVTKQPIKTVLWMSEFAACRFATDVFCVSRSMRRAVIGHGFCSRKKAFTLGDGASHGVDPDKFDPLRNAVRRIDVRRVHGIPGDALVLGYVGRLVPDKGIVELAEAWQILRDRFPHLRLLLCGFLEQDHRLPPGFVQRFFADDRVHLSKHRTYDMPPIYAAMDICVLPTYREGLPNVALEAAAMRLPIVASRVPGCVDVIRDKITGFLVEAKDGPALAEAIAILIQDVALRERMGARAQDLIRRRFSNTRISRLLLAKYKELLLNSRLSTHPVELPQPLGGSAFD